MLISIGSPDYERVLTEEEMARVEGRELEPVLGGAVSDRARLLIQKLPSVIASVLKGSEPEGFHVDSFEIEVQFSGTPFGIGVAGKGKISFKSS
jgi:hypothetical protein